MVILVVDDVVLVILVIVIVGVIAVVADVLLVDVTDAADDNVVDIDLTGVVVDILVCNFLLVVIVVVVVVVVVLVVVVFVDAASIFFSQREFFRLKIDQINRIRGGGGGVARRNHECLPIFHNSEIEMFTLADSDSAFLLRTRA